MYQCYTHTHTNNYSIQMGIYLYGKPTDSKGQYNNDYHTRHSFFTSSKQPDRASDEKWSKLVIFILFCK